MRRIVHGSNLARAIYVMSENVREGVRVIGTIFIYTFFLFPYH